MTFPPRCSISRAKLAFAPGLAAISNMTSAAPAAYSAASRARSPFRSLLRSRLDALPPATLAWLSGTSAETILENDEAGETAEPIDRGIDELIAQHTASKALTVDKPN